MQNIGALRDWPSMAARAAAEENINLKFVFFIRFRNAKNGVKHMYRGVFFCS